MSFLWNLITLMSSSTYNFSLPLESLGKTVLKLYSKVYKSEHTQIETENESLLAQILGLWTLLSHDFTTSKKADFFQYYSSPPGR